MLPENKLKELIGMMNSVSGSAIPPQPPILEMFDIAMDEKMLDYLLAVGTEPHTVAELEAIYRAQGHEDWAQHWKEVLQMSFVHPYTDTQRHLYQLSPIFPGWVEFFTAGPDDPKRFAVLNKFMEFWSMLKLMNRSPMREMSDGATLKAMAAGDPPKVSTFTVQPEGRNISLNQPLESRQEVLTLGSVYNILERNKDEIAIANCFCRRYKKMSKGELCDLDIPQESCVALGAIAKQLVENGTARPMSFEEAVRKMAEFEDNGCIHTTFHNHNRANEEASCFRCGLCGTAGSKTA